MKKNIEAQLMCLLLITIIISSFIFIATKFADAVEGVEQTQEQMVDGCCGSPITERTRMVCGSVVGINYDDSIITLVDDNGEMWSAEVGYPEEFSEEYYYCIFFDTMRTEDIYDDEIIKLWREIW